MQNQTDMLNIHIKYKNLNIQQIQVFCNESVTERRNTEQVCQQLDLTVSKMATVS